MTQFKEKIYFLIKILLSIIMLSGLMAIAANDLAPSVPIFSILITLAALAGVLLVVLGVVIIMAGTLNQSVIRRGGMDTSWLWFNSDPPGFEKIKDELKNSEDTK
jgi:hypothetical protein